MVAHRWLPAAKALSGWGLCGDYRLKPLEGKIVIGMINSNPFWLKTSWGSKPTEPNKAWLGPNPKGLDKNCMLEIQNMGRFLIGHYLLPSQAFFFVIIRFFSHFQQNKRWWIFKQPLFERFLLVSWPGAKVCSIGRWWSYRNNSIRTWTFVFIFMTIVMLINIMTSRESHVGSAL
jgi:hypothetical protein